MEYALEAMTLDGKMLPIDTTKSELEALQFSCDVVENAFYGKSLDIPSYKDGSITRYFYHQDMGDMILDVSHLIYKQISRQLPGTMASYPFYYELLTQHSLVVYINEKEWTEFVEEEEPLISENPLYEKSIR